MKQTFLKCISKWHILTLVLATGVLISVLKVNYVNLANDHNIHS